VAKGSVRPKNLKKCFKLITIGISRGVTEGFEGTLPWGRYGYFLELDNNKNTLHKAKLETLQDSMI